MRDRRVFLAAGATVLFLACVFMPRPVVAQSNTTGALSGRVTDEVGTPLPGATIQIESAALIGGVKGIAADKDGLWRFREIPPGSYTITIAMPGYKTILRKDVRVLLGRTIDVPVEMIQFAGEETMTVVGAAVEIDKTSSATSTVLTDSYLQNLPTGRFQPDTLNLAPGINSGSAYGGGSGSSNAYQIDGVDVSDPDSGTPWSFVNYNIIEEVELVGLGAPAEYGGFTGVVFNSITRSGSNDVEGLIDGIYTGGSLVASNLPPGETAENTTEKSWDTTLQVGGPIIKDRLWYFVSGQYVADDTLQGGTPRTERDPRAFGKLTWQATPNNLIEGFIEWDRYDITGRGGDAFTPLEATVTEDAPEWVWNAAWKSSLSANTVLNVALTGYTGYYYLDPQEGYNIAGHYDYNTGFYSQNSYYFYLADRDRNQLVASLSQHASNFIKGNHDFKFGMEIERSKVRSRYGYPTGVWFYDNYGYDVDPGSGIGEYYSVGYYGGGYDVSCTNKRLSAYVQDSWQITPHFTINPGVRVDFNRGYLEDGDKAFSTTPIAWRIGIAWDMTHDGRTLLKAHAGRYYEALFGAYYYWLTPGAFEDLEQRRVFPSGASDQFAVVPGSQYVMDSNIKHPYVDQYILGIDRELFPGFTLGATAVYRENRDFIESVSRDGTFTPVKGEIPDQQGNPSGEEVTMYDYTFDPVNGDTFILTNPDELWRKYKAVIITGTKRLSDNWQLLASYVWSRTTGTIDNLTFSGTYGGSSPSSFLDTPNSLVNAEGRLTYDNTHQVKLQGQWDIPEINLSLSGNWSIISGDTWNRRSRCLLTDDGNGVLGDGIVDCHSFPQGTVRYFAEPRGSRRLPARNELDVRAEWYKNIGSSDGRIGLFVDIFNINNQGRATEVEDRDGSSFGHPVEFNFPRTIRLGARYTF